jgi:hypothetical protein
MQSGQHWNADDQSWNSNSTAETLGVDSGDVDSAESEAAGLESQINIPPASSHRLWKAIAFALRCPACGSLKHKAETGKRPSREGLREQYRLCATCRIRFRVIWE